MEAKRELFRGFAQISLDLMQNPKLSADDKKDRLLLTALTVLCLFSLSFNLGAIPPYHSDENFYVVSAKNMVETGDYITPVYHERKRFAKPILFYWVTAGFYELFGVHLFSARIGSVLFGAATLWLTYFLARRLFGRKVALLSAFILPGIFLHFQVARWAITDMTLNFFILSAFYFFVTGFQEESKRAKNYLLFYLAIALGFMTKGFPALIIPGLTVALFLLVRRDRETASQMKLGWGALIFLAVNLPWFLAMAALHGDAFTDHILQAEIKDRLLRPRPLSFYYFGVLFRYFLPWSLFLISAMTVTIGSFFSGPLALREKIARAFRRLLEKENAPLLFCLLWILIPLIFFTLVRIQHSRYMLPVSPAMAMLTASLFSRWMESPGGFQQRRFVLPFYLTIILYSLIGLAVVAGMIVYAPVFPVPPSLIFLPLLILFGTLFLFRLKKSTDRVRLVMALAVLQIVGLGPLNGTALPYFNGYPMRTFAQEILKSGTGEEKIGVFKLGNARARIGVLTGYPSAHYSRTRRARQFVQEQGKMFIVMREKHWKERFADLSLALKSRDRGWIESRPGWGTFLEIFRKGLLFDLEHYRENLVLLTKK